VTRLRAIYFVAGWAALGLGAAGTVLPLLPTTPFLLAAAWCFCRSSPRMAGWLLDHPVLGKPLRAWQREGAISTPAKLAAVASMAAGYALSIHVARLGTIPAIALAALLLAVAAFIVTRPAPSAPRHGLAQAKILARIGDVSSSRSRPRRSA
jgi:uncharacterized membrane protein YbaN (DUF454 family)